MAYVLLAKTYFYSLAAYGFPHLFAPNCCSLLLDIITLCSDRFISVMVDALAVCIHLFVTF